MSIDKQLGYTVVNGNDIAPETPAAERDSFHDVVLGRRLRTALERLNPHLPPSAIDDAFRRVTVPQAPALLSNNRAFHRLLVDGVPVEYARDGRMCAYSRRIRRRLVMPYCADSGCADCFNAATSISIRPCVVSPWLS